MAKKRKKIHGGGAKNLLRNNIISIFTADPVRLLNYKQVSSKLTIKDKAGRDLVNTILAELLHEEVIEEVRPGKFRLNAAWAREQHDFSNTITGVVDMKNTGKAYVIPEDDTDDIFIAPNNTYHALHGDVVRVRLFPKRKDKKPEGQIVEIEKRAREQFVGIVEVSKKFAFLVPDSRNMPVDIFIPLDSLKGARNGQKAVARITDWPEHSKNPFGEITDVLGNPGEHNVEMQSILAEHDFPLGFPGNVEKEAENIPWKIPSEEYKKRRDFRDIWTITIDPEDAKDFDDALSLKKLKSGNWEIGVHIADVSYYVKPGSKLDEEGYKRATSVYLVDRVIPMLPEKLSNYVCSLKANEDKLCFSAVFEMDESGDVHKQWFGRTVINSDRRFNYEEVQKIIEKGKGEFAEEIGVLHRIASKLRDDRFKNGSINFSTQEVKFKLDEDGTPLSVYIKEQKDSNRLIEDFMLLANRKVAELIGKKQAKEKPKTFIYRIHDMPSPEKLNTFIEFLGKLGYSLKINSQESLARSFNNLFKQIAGKGEENMIETIAIRTMAKAEYSTDNIGHYGLAFKYYTHFTSPIRRYPDLMVHRLLEHYLEGGSSVSKEVYEDKCVHCSLMERNAIEAERDSVKYKQAEFLLDKVGQEFDGLISGVSKWGIYVEIVGNKCEGMVRLQDLQDDFYYLDEDNYQVIGSRYGQQYKLGDPVRIRVKKIDLSRKQMDFELL
ncbi:MAG: ribonuclease R [Bacteroidales bacterium]|jgi:ribonuclease R|nr:ribonuclease R [Bacteroidales bacterium]